MGTHARSLVVKGSPNIDPSDQVIPLHWFEDGFMWKKVIVYTLFVFDDVLDPDHLRQSLEALIARDGYKKLGGRLRKNVRTPTFRFRLRIL